MEINTVFNKIKLAINKYKYSIIILLIGCVFLMAPGFEANKDQEAAKEQTQEILSEPINELLEKILEKIDGAGDVEVMLSTAEGEKTLYQTDSKVTDSETNNTTDISTIIVSDEKRTQAGLVQQIISPKYQGAIIVCEGAENPTVRLSIMDAVSKITGLKTDKISVLKMK